MPVSDCTIHANGISHKFKVHSLSAQLWKLEKKKRKKKRKFPVHKSQIKAVAVAYGSGLFHV